MSNDNFLMWFFIFYGIMSLVKDTKSVAIAAYEYKKAKDNN